MRTFIRLILTAKKSRSQYMIKKYLRGYLVSKNFAEDYKRIQYAIINDNFNFIKDRDL